MAQVTSSQATSWTAEDITSRFGPIPLTRIVMDPAPGTATIEDVLYFDDHKDQLCELIDATLVRKTMGAYESLLAVHLITLINTFVTANKLGVVFGEAGMLQLFADEVRIPDVSFISHARLANSGFPHEAAPLVAPDLAVEVVSRGNTRQEMDRKLKEYFEAGTRAVWYVYPEKKKVLVYNSADTYTELGENDVLDGAPVLPGFTLELKDLFAQPGKAPA